MNAPDWTPVTLQNCGDVHGPFFHGSPYRLNIGDYLTAGRRSNYEPDRVMNHVYFSTLMEPAIWAAELGVALSLAPGPGYIYVVAPMGSFEDDPNLTNKRFPGNPTCSYRTRHPLKIVGCIDDWTGHPVDVLASMLDGLKKKLLAGTAPIED